MPLPPPAATLLAGRSYRAKTVTLTSSASSYSLATLLLALDPTFPLTGREVAIQPMSPAGTVYIGESDVSPTNCGQAQATGTARIYRSQVSDIPIAMFFLQGSVGAMLVNVEVLN